MNKLLSRNDGTLMQTKVCVRCEEEKPSTEFGKRSRSPDGLNYYCKLCTRAMGCESYHRHREARLAHDAQYYQEHKEERLAYAAQYHREHREQRTRYNREHKEEKRAYSAQHYREHKGEYATNVSRWQEENPEHVREIRLAASHRRRARKVNAKGSFTLEEFKSLCSHHGNACLACGRLDVLLTSDHIVPLSQGGSDYISNIQPLCRSCNSSKGMQTVNYKPDKDLKGATMTEPSRILSPEDLSHVVVERLEGYLHFLDDYYEDQEWDVSFPFSTADDTLIIHVTIDDLSFEITIKEGQ